MGNQLKCIWERRNWTDFSWSSDDLMLHLGKTRKAQGKILDRVQAFGSLLMSQAQAEILTEEAV